jgi:hypothetical protein
MSVSSKGLFSIGLAVCVGVVYVRSNIGHEGYQPGSEPVIAAASMTATTAGKTVSTSIQSWQNTISGEVTPFIVAVRDWPGKVTLV